MYNFSAGPAMLPDAVMQRVQRDLRNFNDLGVSVMELSHRSPEFIELAKESTALLRELMGIPAGITCYFCKEARADSLRQCRKI